MLNRVCKTLSFCMLIGLQTAQDFSWAVSISVQSGNFQDANTVIGISEAATDGYDGPPLDIPNMPPFSPPFIDAFVPHPDWGNYATDYAVDFRSLETTQQEWGISINGSGLTENIQVSIMDTAECRLWELLYISTDETIEILPADTTVIELNSSEDTQFSINADYFGISGDVNFDGNIDVLDVVKVVAFILGNEVANGCETWAADLQADGLVDILDVVTLVSIVMEIVFNRNPANE